MGAQEWVVDSQAVISTPRQQGKEPQELVLAFTSAPVPGSQIWGSALCLSQIVQRLWC